MPERTRLADLSINEDAPPVPGIRSRELLTVHHPQKPLGEVPKDVPGHEESDQFEGETTPLEKDLRDDER